MGAFDYASKDSQQRVAFIGKSYPSRAGVIPVGAKTFTLTSPSSVLKKTLEISGSGAVNFAAVSSGGATADTIRLKITLDSRVIVDSSIGTASSNTGFAAIGTLLIDVANGVCNYGIQRIKFEKSLLVEFSGAAGQGVNVYVDYEVNA